MIVTNVRKLKIIFEVNKKFYEIVASRVKLIKKGPHKSSRRRLL